MNAKRPLTPAEWIEAIERSIRAEQHGTNLGLGLLVTLPVAVYDQWAKLRWRLAELSLWLQDHRADATGGYHLKTPEYDGFDWFRQVKPEGTRKRSLARSEWVLLGEQVKGMRAEFNAIEAIVGRAYPIAQTTRWVALIRTVDRLKSKLDGECCRQHPDWSQATSVFYGPTLIENPELAGTVDLEEMAAIAKMSNDEAHAVAWYTPGTKPLRHWSQVLPLRSKRQQPAA